MIKGWCTDMGGRGTFVSGNPVPKNSKASRIIPYKGKP